MTDYKKSPEPDLEIQYFDKNVLWIGASGASVFSEGETMAQGLILEYDSDGEAVGVVLTRSALNKLKDFLYPGSTEYPESPEKEQKADHKNTEGDRGTSNKSHRTAASAEGKGDL